MTDDVKAALERLYEEAQKTCHNGRESDHMKLEELYCDYEIIDAHLTAPSVPAGTEAVRDGAIDECIQISDEEIISAWGNANFGDNADKRKIILETLLQIGGGFSTGHTAMCICKDLGLVTVGSTSRKINLTKKGKRVMYYWNKHRADECKESIKLEIYKDD